MRLVRARLSNNATGAAATLTPRPQLHQHHNHNHAQCHVPLKAIRLNISVPKQNVSAHLSSLQRPILLSTPICAPPTTGPLVCSPHLPRPSLHRTARAPSVLHPFAHQVDCATKCRLCGSAQHLGTGQAALGLRRGHTPGHAAQGH